MLDEDVRLEVALVFGAVRTVRAQQARRLAALQLEVLPQVTFPAVHLATLRAGEVTRCVARLGQQQVAL